MAEAGDAAAVKPIALTAADAPPRAKPSNYPPPFAKSLGGRVKQPLGDLFGLTNFGVNRTSFAPGAQSALFHAHSLQDEFVYVLSGELLLRSGVAETLLTAGMCAGFAHGGAAHQLINRSAAEAVILEIGDRSIGDTVTYPEDDLQAVMGEDGKWRYARQDGTAW